MLCAKPACLASYTWFGHPDDPALRKLAEDSGWRLLEGDGWLCPGHQPALSTPVDQQEGGA